MILTYRASSAHISPSLTRGRIKAGLTAYCEMRCIMQWEEIKFQVVCFHLDLQHTLGLLQFHRCPACERHDPYSSGRLGRN